MMVDCKDCGNSAFSGDNFCRGCGNEIEEHDVHTCDCGAVVHEEDKFCHGCGAEFDGVEEVEEAEEEKE